MSTPSRRSWRERFFGRSSSSASGVADRNAQRPAPSRPPLPETREPSKPSETPQRQQQRLYAELLSTWAPKPGQRVPVEEAARIGIAEHEWARLRPQVLGASPFTGAPAVLYTLVDGDGTFDGWMFEKKRRLKVFIEVFADATASRKAWQLGTAMTAANVALSDNKPIVANLTGVPKTPTLVLTLRRVHDSYQLPAHRIHAQEGTPAADVIRALHMVARVKEHEQISGVIEDLPRTFGVAIPLEWSVQEKRVVERVYQPPRPSRSPQRAQRPKPSPRMVRDAREAEHLAAEWVRWMGWSTARVTQEGTDEGVDVSNGQVVAQVKFEAVKTGRPTLQALFGAGHGMGAKHWVFFASAGYTPPAVAWADQVGMALFRFTLDGSIEPVNNRARAYYARGS